MERNHLTLMLTYKEIHLQFKNARTERDLPGIEKVWAYLAARGISRETADKLGLHIVKAMELIAAARKTPNIMVDTRAAVIFPHYRVADDEAIEWWSSRLVDIVDLGPRVVASFGDMVDPEKRKKPGKMFCPPNEPPAGYLCPLNRWAEIPNGARVYIHESCIKSVNGALLGKFSIGLNGVWGWTSAKHNISLIPELRDIPWKARALVPVIVFDSNVRTNWMVATAESRLAAKIHEITGQKAIALRVPVPEGGGDWGFDDYRMAVGDTEALEFLEGDGQEVDVSEFEQLRVRLNSEVCVVRDLARVAVQQTGLIMSKSDFCEMNYAHYTAEMEVGDTMKQVSVPKLWLMDDRRVEVQCLDYMPGRELMCDGKLNLWHGMGVEPEAGDVDLWMELLNNNVEDEWLKSWMISWLAYPQQNPGAKMNSLLLLFGPSGVGKGLWLDPLRTIYGENGVVISNEQLKSQFNSVYSKKQFVHIDELQKARSEADAVNQKIKLLTTDKKMLVNRKGDPEYTITNTINLAITSNYRDCLKLDQDDRRVCVVKWEPLSSRVDHRGNQVYWREYVDWAKSVGPAALLQFLLEWDCSKFDPYAWAPATEWKSEVTEASMAPMDLWVKDLWAEPDIVLPLTGQGRALWTAKELAVLYYGEGENELTHGKIKSIVNALGNKGFKQAAKGAPIRPGGREGVQQRYWVIRDRENKKWVDSPQCLGHLKQWFKG